MIEDVLKSHGDYYNDKTFKELTTIRMGGPIRHLVYPNSVDDLKEIIDYLRNNHYEYKFLGNGSNLICGESLYEGVVICLKKIDSYEISGDEAYVEAGVKAPLFSNILAQNGLSGLEFASSIPGDIGGLLFMNAGAYKEAMSDVVEEVLVLRRGELVWMKKDELEYGYRSSVFQKHPHWAVIAAKMRFKKKDPTEIFDLMEDRLNRRKNTQPLEKHSAGSCFRNPDGDYAWKYLDELGYRGYSVNDVKVSEKHSNFIINEGNGTASDYLSIVYDIQKNVLDKYGIKLIMEVEKFNC